MEIQNHSDVIHFIEKYKNIEQEIPDLKKSIYLSIHYFNRNIQEFSQIEKNNILKVFLNNPIFFSKINQKSFPHFFLNAIEKKEPLKFYNTNILSFGKVKNNDDFQIFMQYFDLLNESSDEEQFFLFFDVNRSLIKKHIHLFLSKQNTPQFRAGILKFLPNLASNVNISKQEIISFSSKYCIPYENIQNLVPQFNQEGQFILISPIANQILLKIEKNDFQFEKEFDFILKNPRPFLQYFYQKNPMLLKKFLESSDKNFPTIKAFKYEKNIAQSFLFYSFQNQSPREITENVKFFTKHFLKVLLQPIKMQIGFLEENFENIHYFNYLLDKKSSYLNYFSSSLELLDEKEKKLCLIGFFDHFVYTLNPQHMSSIEEHQAKIANVFDFTLISKLIDIFGLNTFRLYYKKSISLLDIQNSKKFHPKLQKIIHEQQEKIKKIFLKEELNIQLDSSQENHPKIKI